MGPGMADGFGDGVIRALDQAGYEAEAPTMLGHHPGDNRTGLTFQGYVDQVVENLKSQVRALWCWWAIPAPGF